MDDVIVFQLLPMASLEHTLHNGKCEGVAEKARVFFISSKKREALQTDAAKCAKASFY